MELFYIIIKTGTESKTFVQTIYRTSISTSNDIGDAIMVKTLEDAKALKRIVIERTDYISDNIKIYKQVTTNDILED